MKLVNSVMATRPSGVARVLPRLSTMSTPSLPPLWSRRTLMSRINPRLMLSLMSLMVQPTKPSLVQMPFLVFLSLSPRLVLLRRVFLFMLTSPTLLAPRSLMFFPSPSWMFSTVDHTLVAVSLSKNSWLFLGRSLSPFTFPLLIM